MALLSAKLSPEQLADLRRIIKTGKNVTQVRMAQVIILVDERQSAKTIKTVTGFGRSRAFALRQLYLKNGSKVLDVKQRGIKELLSRSQLEEIVKVVSKKKPVEVGFHESYEFWNTGVLARFIQREYGVNYKSKTSYYLVFKKVKFTYHKPGRVYQKHDAVKVEAWKKDTLPLVKQAWEDPQTIVLCEDEMKLSTQTTFQKIWLPKNEYPQVKVANKKEGRSIYGFLNIKTGVCHAFKTLWQNMYITKAQLIKIRQIYPQKHLLILWDGPGSHRGKEVTRFLQEDGNMEVIYFPPYAPEENPQEHVWRESRKEVTHNRFIDNIDTATDDFVNFLNTTSFPYKLLEFKSTLVM